MEVRIEPFEEMKFFHFLNVKVNIEYPYVLAKYNKDKKLLYKIEKCITKNYWSRDSYTLRLFKYLKFSNKDFYNQNTFNNFTNIQNADFPKITDVNNVNYEHEIWFGLHEESFFFWEDKANASNRIRIFQDYRPLPPLLLSDNIACEMDYFKYNTRDMRGNEYFIFRCFLKFEDE